MQLIRIYVAWSRIIGIIEIKTCGFKQETQ